MTPNNCLLFLATFCVLIAEGFYASGNPISEPVQTALFVRSKRDDGRSMSFSGFFPYGGMTTYASGGDWGNWYKGHGNRKPAVFNEAGWNRPQKPVETEDASSPEVTETPWIDNPHSTPQVNKEEEHPVVNKKPKKKPTHHKEKSSEEEEEDETPNRSSGSNAAASVNAWFPIMLGMFPQEEGVNGYSSSSRKSQPPTTVVANSVSHGPGGVASSHAIAYGALPEQFFRSRH